MIKEEMIRRNHVKMVAESMMTAARTAPKGCGIDDLEIAVLEGEELSVLSRTMREIGTRIGKDFFIRDAGNVDASQAVVLLGCRGAVRGLNCGLCGYAGCGAKPSAVPCSFDVTDLGIAVGAAVSVAADSRVDNRVMFSAGAAAREAGFLTDCCIVYAIPLSVSCKSIFFDRQQLR